MADEPGNVEAPLRVTVSTHDRGYPRSLPVDLHRDLAQVREVSTHDRGYPRSLLSAV
jgi:hypothetical protein